MNRFDIVKEYLSDCKDWLYDNKKELAITALALAGTVFLGNRLHTWGYNNAMAEHRASRAMNVEMRDVDGNGMQDIIVTGEDGRKKLFFGVKAQQNDVVFKDLEQLEQELEEGK